MLSVHRFGVLLSVAVPLLLAGCAMFRVEESRAVGVIAPADASLFLLDADTLPVPLPLHSRPDSSRYLLLPTDRDQRIVARAGSAPADTLLLRRFMIVPGIFGSRYVDPEFVMAMPFGLGGGNYGFANASVVYTAEDSIAGWRVIPGDAIVRERREPGSILLHGYLGWAFPPVFSYNGSAAVALGAGYELLPGFSVSGMAEWYTSTDLSSYQGDLMLDPERRASLPPRDVSSRTFGLYLRYHPLTGLFADRHDPLNFLFISAGGGMTTISSDSLFRRSSGSLVGGFTDQLPTANLGVGASWMGLTLEYRWIIGTERVALAPGSTAALRWRNFRFGMACPL